MGELAFFVIGSWGSNVADARNIKRARMTVFQQGLGQQDLWDVSQMVQAAHLHGRACAECERDGSATRNSVVCRVDGESL